VFLLLRGRKPWLTRLRRKPLLTTNEAVFLHRLQRALPRFHVFPQVSFSAFLTDDGQLSGKAQWAVRAKFDRKIADFVVCDREALRVVALIELMTACTPHRQTGSGTPSPTRQAIRRFRYKSKQKPTEAEIAALFQHARVWVPD
jgi:hypothetical protein